MKSRILRLVSYVSNEACFEKPSVLYFGVDPTADSLHLGHLLSLQLAKELRDLGWKVVILLGGYTGTIGDPSGKSKVRKTLEKNTVKQNSSGLLQGLQKILSPSEKVIYVNNKDWLENMSLGKLLFYGKFLSVNGLIKLDTFSQRLTKSMPLCFSEISYPLLQAIDFMYLHKNYGVTLQIGGQDQWGNISTGVSFVKKCLNARQEKSEHKIAGAVTHLLEVGGKKIGKTTGHSLALNQKPINLFVNIYALPDEVIAKLMQLMMDQEYSADDHHNNRLQLIEYIFNFAKIDDFKGTKNSYETGMRGETKKYIPTKQRYLIGLLKEQLKISGQEARRVLAGKILVNDKIPQVGCEFSPGNYCIKYNKNKLPLFVTIS
jgi:tyrosyl-tRNA synthetase